MRPISDMYLAAALLAYDVHLHSINQENPLRNEFNFEEKVKRVFVLENGGDIMVVENPSFNEVETFFIRRVLLFPPSYPDAIKRIKSAIHAKR